MRSSKKGLLITLVVRARIIGVWAQYWLGGRARAQDYRCTDDTAANDNLAALEEFFRLFPEYSKQPFYLTGTAPHWRCAHTRADFVLGACHARQPGVGACACAHAYAIVRGGSAMMQHAMYRCRSACTCTACSPPGRLCPWAAAGVFGSQAYCNTHSTPCCNAARGVLPSQCGAGRRIVRRSLRAHAC